MDARTSNAIVLGVLGGGLFLLTRSGGGEKTAGNGSVQQGADATARASSASASGMAHYHAASSLAAQQWDSSSAGQYHHDHHHNQAAAHPTAVTQSSSASQDASARARPLQLPTVIAIVVLILFRRTLWQETTPQRVCSLLAVGLSHYVVERGGNYQSALVAAFCALIGIPAAMSVITSRYASASS